METFDEGDAPPRGPARAVSATMQTVHDPSTSSYYVNEQLYRDLVTSFTDWQRDDLAVHDPSERDQFRILVEKQARLLAHLSFYQCLSFHSPQSISCFP